MRKLPKDIQKELTKVIEDDERIIDYIKEPWSLYKLSRWTVLTNRQLVIVKKDPLDLTHNVTRIDLSDADIDLKEGLIFDSIPIIEGVKDYNIQFFSTRRKRTTEFYNNLDKARENAQKERGAGDIVSELEGLARVFHERIITKGEYEKKKKEILDRL